MGQPEALQRQPGEDQEHRSVVSVSSVSTLLTCPRRYKYAVIDGWRPRRTKPALSFGSAIHEGLQAYYAPDLMKQTPEQAIEAWHERQLALLDAPQPGAGKFSAASTVEKNEREEYLLELADLRDRAKRVMARYAARYANESERWEIVSVEQAYRVPLLTDQGRTSSRWDLAIRPDMVLRDRITGHYWVRDHKTTAVANPSQVQRSLESSPQLRVYLGALKRLFGWYLHGIEFNVIRSREPGVPAINKDGTVSKVACDTLLSEYRAAWDRAQADLIASGKKAMVWTDYMDRFSVLERRGDSFLYRFEQFVAPWDQEMALTEMWRAARMVKPLAAQGWPRNLGACLIPGRECPFRSTCLDAHCSQEQWETSFVRTSGGTLGAPEIPPAAFAGAAGIGSDATPHASVNEVEEV